MLKPDSLRAALTAALGADALTDPQRFQLLINKGSIRSTLAHGNAPPVLAFEYRYTLDITLIDFPGHPDQVMVPLLAWLSVNQPDLFTNYDKQRDGIQFEAEIVDNGKVDMSVYLQLTEAVTVAVRDDGGYDVTHRPEPPLDPPFDDVTNDPRLWHLFLGPDQLLEWQAPGIIIRPEL